MKPLVADIYHQNAVTSFSEAYKAGLRAVIHKASQGSHFKDPKFLERRKQIRDAGMLVGAYHFTDGSNVKTQVSNFLKAAKLDDQTLVCLDYEPSSKYGTMNIKQAKVWLESIYKETGQRPLIYSGHLLKETIDNDKEFWSKHRLWLAQYSDKPTLPKHFDNYWIWQYTGDGRGPEPHKWPGFSGFVDLNVFNGSEKELKEQWIQTESMSQRIINFDPTGIVRTIKDWVTAEELDDLPNTEQPKDGKLPWMETAKKLMGTDETPGSKNNPIIMSWAKKINNKDYTADSIPWCGLFVGYVCSMHAMDIPDTPLWALSWKSDFGRALSEPKYGCVLVFKRDGGGHVGFAVGQDDDYFHVLGGNQSDTVNIAKIAKSRCVGYRWPNEFDIKLAKPLPFQSINASISENEA